VVANRNRAEVEPLIGLLLDTQVIRTRLDPAQSFESLLQQVRATLIQAYLHQELPFDKLLERLEPARRPGVPPLFQVMFQMQSLPDPVVTLPELSIEVLPPSEHSVKFDLTVYVTERDGALQFAYEYDVALFETATIERLAARFARLLEALVATPAARIDELGVPEALPATAGQIITVPDGGARRELSAHQQRLWFIDASEAGVLYEAAPTYHNLQLLLEFGAAVSSAQLEAALNVVVARHDALRTRIGNDGLVAWQSVDAQAPMALEQIDVKDGETLMACAVAATERPFKLDRDRLVRATLLHGRSSETWLCLAVHHVVADRRSLQLIAQELVAAYAAIVEGHTPALPALQLSFGDYVRWQSAFSPEALEPLWLYWKLQLHGRLQAMEFPLNRRRPAVHAFIAGRHSSAVGAELGERLRALAQDRAVTIEDVLLTGFNALLRRYAGHDELVIGTSVEGRGPSGLQPVVGPLANLLVLRTVVPPECSFETLLACVARCQARAVQHPRQEVAPQRVGSHRVGRGGRPERLLEADAAIGVGNGRHQEDAQRGAGRRGRRRVPRDEPEGGVVEQGSHEGEIGQGRSRDASADPGQDRPVVREERGENTGERHGQDDPDRGARFTDHRPGPSGVPRGCADPRTGRGRPRAGGRRARGSPREGSVP